MSVTNGMISYRMGKKLGVGGDGDLQLVFAVSQMNQSWYFDSAPINKWARYKPFRSTQAFSDHFTGPGGESITSARLTAAAAANFGLSAPAAQTTQAATLSTEWVYNRPTSGGSWLCRAQDFEGYNHKASQPVEPPGPLTINMTPTMTIDFANYIFHNPDLTAIGWGDLTAISGYYLCVVFARNSSLSGTVMWKTSAQTFASGASMRLPISNAELQTIQASGYTHYYLCACSVSKTGFDDAAPADARFMALPCNSTASLLDTFTVRTPSFANVAVKSLNVSQSPSSAAQFADATNYTGIVPLVDDLDTIYYPCTPVGGYYYLHIGIEIEAGSSPYTVYPGSFALSATFAGNGFSTAYAQAATLRNSSFAVQSQIAIAANSSQVMYFTFAVPLLSLDSQGQQVGGLSTGQYVSAGITMVQNGNPIRIGEIRVRN